MGGPSEATKVSLNSSKQGQSTIQKQIFFRDQALSVFKIANVKFGKIRTDFISMS